MTEPSTGAGGTAVTIRIPGTPDRCLSPNASRMTHWGTKTKARNQLLGDAKGAALGEIGAGREEPVFRGAVRVRTVIAWEKGRKRMDGDNALASCKALYDGLTQAGVWIDDRSCIFDPVEQIRDKAGVGYVEVTIVAAAGQEAERVTRATLLRYVDRPCSMCGVSFRVLETRKRTECYTCKPTKGRRKP